MAAESGVNRTTIQDIETNKHGKPQLGTVAKLIEAMPPLTLSTFFSIIEQGSRGHDPGVALRPREEGARDYAVSPEAPPFVDSATALGRELARFIHAELTSRQAASAGTVRSPGRKGDRKNR